MSGRRPGAGTPATVALTKAGVHEYTHDPRSELSFGLEAAHALGVPAEAVFKTLLVRFDGARPPLAVGVVPVSSSLGLKAIAAALGHKRAVMADPAEAERATGYVVGGISPIGQKTRLPLVLDDSARDLDRIYVSGGKRGLDLALRPDDLLAVTGGSYAAIAAD